MSEEILKAKKEVRERVRQLADDELEKVAGGAGSSLTCKYCGSSNVSVSGRTASGGTAVFCYSCSQVTEYGDTRIGMDEGMADIDGLTADVDGFDA